MEVLTAEKLMEMMQSVRDLNFPNHYAPLFEALKPYLKECSACNGSGRAVRVRRSEAGSLVYPRCPECKPERRKGQQRLLADRRDNIRLLGRRIASETSVTGKYQRRKKDRRTNEQI